ncbi:hypothetical protein EYB45_04190 [Erythrobacteraceae bacterium CFH 75059]|uniref:hypothetical protein n=1 Tax=Qipengyuania thermophila TaxID=2509361 RepID=UPI001020B3F2|nr:hypothetical protein [Qipengyuania thermophila]TCD06881.1 hypothetical protein EYB45_04190 [Erythrobacteraceae bacterium CFH 75059]
MNERTRWSGARAAEAASRRRTRDWRRAMSDNVATALLVYTTLQIFLTVKALAKATDYSLWPYVSLVGMVALFIPFGRSAERRWAALSDARAADPALAPHFRRDQALVWSLAIGLPLLLTWVFRLLFAAA